MDFADAGDGKGLLTVASYSSEAMKPKVLDRFVLYEIEEGSEHSAGPLIMTWAESGEQVAILFKDNFRFILDFAKQTIFTTTPEAHANQKWRCIHLDSYAQAMEPFYTELLVIQNKKITRLIQTFQAEPTQQNQLQLYKMLMTATLVVPISAPASDKEHLILTFPHEDEQILCTFTDEPSLSATLGEDIHSKKIQARFLFAEAPNYNVDKVLISSQSGVSYMIEKSDFALLGVLEATSGMNYRTLTEALGKFFIQEPEGVSEALLNIIQETVKDFEIIDQAYLYQSTSDEKGISLGLIVSEPDDRELVRLYQAIRQQRQAQDIKEELDVLVLDAENQQLRVAVQASMSPIYERDGFNAAEPGKTIHSVDPMPVEIPEHPQSPVINRDETL